MCKSPCDPVNLNQIIMMSEIIVTVGHEDRRLSR